jgi:hypothetical protein
MSNLIWIPRSTVERTLLDARLGRSNFCSCVKFDYHGYEVSLALDSGYGPTANLVRGEFRVYRGVSDLTAELFPHEQLLFGNVDTLLRIFRVIDEHIKSEAK